MNKELEGKLLEALTATINTVGDAKDFLIKEIPEVLQQALLWHGAYNFIQMIGGIAIIIFMIIYVKWAMKLYTNKESSIYVNGKIDVDRIFPLLIISLFTLIPSFAIAVNTLNLEWLKILIAPKLWLLEYIKALGA